MEVGSVDRLREAARAGFPRAVADLRTLVRQPSVAAQGVGITETVALTSQLLAEAGGRVRVLEGAGNPVILAEFGTTGPTLLFYDHYDVQPAEPLDEWTSPPWEPAERDGKLFGRGVSDNKGEIAVRLAAVRALQEQGPLPCRIKFMIEGEEEIGSPNLESMVQLYRADFAARACIWEFGSVDALDRPQLYGGVKGMAYLQLRVRLADVDMHSSYAAVTQNAAWRLTWALASLKGPDNRVRVPGFYDNITPPTPRERALAAQIPFDPVQFSRTFGLQAPLLTGDDPARAVAELVFAPTCTICGLESGYYGAGAKTVLPRAAQAKVDCRLVPGQDPAEIVRLVRAHLDAAGFADVEVELLTGELAYWTNPEDPFVGLALRTAEEAWGRPAVYHLSSAGTGPMHQVGSALRLPIVSAGSGYYGSRAHAPDEHVRLADLEKGILHMALLMQQFGSSRGA